MDENHNRAESTGSYDGLDDSTTNRVRASVTRSCAPLCVRLVVLNNPPALGDVNVSDPNVIGGHVFSVLSESEYWKSV
jgi:hypothetical protein